MKVLQINSVCGYGSTGRNVLEIANELNKRNDRCYIAYGFGNTEYPNAIKIGNKLDHYYHNIYSRLLGKQGYCSKKSTKIFIDCINFINPDIIHLNNLHAHYLNLEVLFNYLKKSKKPVIWTLHDCWAFTGKCAHFTETGCDKWKTQCESCPQIRTYPPSIFRDYSKQAYIDKKRLFTSVDNLKVVTVSKWLAEKVRESFLSKYNIEVIYNWVDVDIFKPTNSYNIQEKYNLHGKFVILGICSKWSLRKGLQDFITLSKMIDNNSIIILVGIMKKSIDLPQNIISISATSSKYELAQIYSTADVFINPSLEESFGKVTAEALACGTPSIVYNVTACPELIGDGCGYVVEKSDVKGINKAIEIIKTNGKNVYSKNCVKYVNENFEKNKNIEKYHNLYQKLLNK